MTLGVDRLLQDPGASPAWLSSGRKLGLLTSRGAGPGPGTETSTPRALQRAGVPLARLFAPEHGLSAREKDGIPVEDKVDGETGLTIVSLYGRHLTPPPESVADLDGVLVDLQDVGVRFYTYCRTMQFVMVSCAEARIPVAVLDRPNPLGGRLEEVEGPLPDWDLPTSFLSPWPVPIRHSLTLGEMALLLRAEMKLGLHLDVVSMDGWQREMRWPDTGLPFRPPSPGLPRVQAVFLYPGLALLEATNIREGRGTAESFQWLGAPWMNGEKTAEGLSRLGITGLQVSPYMLSATGLPVAGRPHGLQEVGQTAEGQGGAGPATPTQNGPCPGVRLKVTDPRIFRPVAAGLRILAGLRTLYPEDFSWAPYPTTVNPEGRNHLLHLLRSRALVRILREEPERLLAEDPAREATGARGWQDRVRPHLLYV